MSQDELSSPLEGSSYSLLSLPEVDPERAMFPREQWGTLAMDVEDLPEHVSLEFVRAPEGWVHVGRCAACGGREEVLVDFRAAWREEHGEPKEGPGGEVQIPEEVQERLNWAVEAAAATMTEQWLPTHEEQCPNDPLHYHLPASVKAFVGTALERYRDAVGRGEELPAQLFLLLGDERVMVGRFDKLVTVSEDKTEHYAQVSARLHAVRDMLRARQLNVLAAVVVSEAWIRMPDDSKRGPTPREVVVVTVTTPTFGRIGYAPITRESGTAGEGPGTFEDPELEPLGQSFPLIDGVFATSDFLPQSERERQRARGLMLDR